LDFSDLSILVTGGTGSFGNAFARYALTHLRPRRLVIFSRDEVKQLEMRRALGASGDTVRWFIGDVRDKSRLYRAFRGVDVIVHAAALKQVPTAEYNPLEVIQTNVLGAANLIDAAIDCGVRRVIALSSDKAVAPANLYGATKLCADKLFIAAHHYAGERDTRFAVVRYGNVAGSRGSVVPFFFERRQTGVLPLTDPRMTRFWIELDQAVRFVHRAAAAMLGSEIFVPKLPSVRIVDVARAIGPACRHEVIGCRLGEKLHEVLIGEEESGRSVEYDDLYVVHPFSAERAELGPLGRGRRVEDGFVYASDRNPHWLGVEELRRALGTAGEPRTLGAAGA
jgi:UDP-N-acetylglucosamine 4,6-dehydratase